MPALRAAIAAWEFRKRNSWFDSWFPRFLKTGRPSGSYEFTSIQSANSC